MGPRRRRSSSWRAAPAVGHSRRETKPCPHASSGREGPVRIPANEGDGTDELPENVGFQRHLRPQLSADSNAPTESLWGSLNQARIHGQRFATRREAMDEVIDWLSFCNHGRLHSTLNYVSPMQFEQNWYAAQRKAAA